MAARVAARIGVDADQLEPAGLDAGLLHQLAPARVLHRLADVHEPARQRVLALERRVLAPDEQQAPLGVDHDAVDGECRCLGKGHGPLEGVSDPLASDTWRTDRMALRLGSERAWCQTSADLTPRAGKGSDPLCAHASLPAQRPRSTSSITSPVMGTSAPPVLSFAHDGDGTAGRRSAARMAPAPAHEPARSRLARPRSRRGT